MTVILSDKLLLDYLKPTKCAKRVYLRRSKAPEAGPDEFQAVLDAATVKLIASQRTTLGAIAVSDDFHTRLPATLMASKTPAIFQPFIQAQTKISGTACTLSGKPDFLLRAEDGSGYKIRLCDSSHIVSESQPAQVHARLQFYALIFQLAFGKAPAALEIIDGAGDVITVAQTNKNLKETLEALLAASLATSEPYEPVGRSKCITCPFYKRCWSEAVQRNDVALLKGVDQNMAIALLEMGVPTIKALFDKFGDDHLELARVKRRWGKKMSPVGAKAALTIMRFARAVVTGTVELIALPPIPDVANFVMFDLEGMPDQLDRLAPIYLWGLQVFGKNGGPFSPAEAPFGSDGDQLGWQAFLQAAKAIFDQHGDIPFVHWDKYEKTKLDAYVRRFGDENGIAARVRANLLDLRVVLEESLVLPIGSYSLKVVEQYIGYKRSQTEFGTNWSIQKYVEARDTADGAVREEIMSRIRTYNAEDLEAMWATLCWFRQRVSELTSNLTLTRNKK
jgi:predicted RecB family nuclease